MVACALVSIPAWAVEPFTVRDIRVEGLQRIEPGTVFASLPFRVGDRYSDDQGAAAIRALFALGLFKDVRLEAVGGVLVVVVEERPTIADVDFAGTKEFDKDALAKALKDVGIGEGQPFDRALADRIDDYAPRLVVHVDRQRAALLGVRALLNSRLVRGPVAWMPFVLLILVFVLGFLGLEREGFGFDTDGKHRRLDGTVRQIALDIAIEIVAIGAGQQGS